MPETLTEPCPVCGSLLDVTGAKIFASRTCPVCSAAINVQRTFGHYELLGVLGHGGQGIVYRASDTTLNREVALKLLRAEHSLDPEFIKQFEAEAQVTASINHPNVVRVFSSGADEGHVYLAMELVSGGTMDDLMEKLKRVPEARALEIGIEIAQGLRAGYANGLIHRDIKPGNILFSENGTAKVVDFGLALFFEQEAEASGEIWGTPYYLSPERLNRVPEDFRSDIYSLGATLFHAIAGRPPFEAEDASHVALKHLSTQAVSLQSFAPTVANSTAYVINRTLLKDPDARQQSYDEFIEQLQFAREEAFARAKAGGQQQQKSRVVLDNAEGERAKSWITITTLILLVAGLAVGAMLLKKAILGGDESAVVQPGQTAATSVEGFGPGWKEAQQSLFAGSYQKAAEAFSALAGKHAKGTPEQAWAIVHQALAAQLSNGSGAAATVLGQLDDGSTQVSKFFGKEIAPRLAGAAAVPATTARDFSNDNHQALGALFLGLKDYDLGVVEDARSLISQFTRMEPGPAVAWLAEYKKFGNPMQAEFTTYGLAADAWRTASTPQQRDQALAALRTLPGKLPPRSKLIPQARKALADAEKTVAEARQAMLKKNLATSGKLTSSEPKPDKEGAPEFALDGDPSTKWKDGKAGPKWLAVEFPSNTTISRWVVRHAGSAPAGKTEENTVDFTLQSSADGQNWNDVDSVTDNHFSTTDRIIPPLSERHVRVLITKATDTPNDTSARIFELQLGEAAEQPKAGYAPGDNVATRFSPASPFVTGPIGSVGAAGGVQFDEKKKLYTVSGSGADIWTKDDAFQFAWMPMKGDGELVARVLKLEKKHEWTKAGLMIRSALTKNAAHGLAAFGPDGKGQFLSRKQAGEVTEGPQKIGLALPRWLKIARQGATITSYESSDGQKWNELGRQTLAGLGEVAYIGLAVCSHADGQTAAAEFSDVTPGKAQP